MRLKLSLRVGAVAPDSPKTNDILVAADVTVTVGQIAGQILGQSVAPRDVTLRVQYPGSEDMVALDSFAPLPLAHLRPGSIVEAVAVSEVAAADRRAYNIRAVCTDHDANVWPLLDGHNVIGRGSHARICLPSRTVSRKHADIIVGNGTVRISDLGAANGVFVNDVPVSTALLHQGDVIQIGDQRLTLQCSLAPMQPPVPATITEHVRPPRVESYAQSRQLTLPAPPEAVTPQHMPLLAVIAPLIMGVASFAMTQSPYALILVALSPLMMLGTWLDGILGVKKDYKRRHAAYHAGLQRLDEAVSDQQAKESDIRHAEFPSTQVLAEEIMHCTDLLWTRRPEHSTFLKLRVGLGSDRSRIQVGLPDRSNISDDVWTTLTALQQRHEQVEPVPLLVSLQEAGGLGVVGEHHARTDLMRSIVLQLAALHAPSEMVIVALADHTLATHWSWLKWLPHVDPPRSPLGGFQLAAGVEQSSRLMASIEEIVARRQESAGARAPRSHLPANHRVSESNGKPVTELPMLPTLIILIIGDPGVDSGRLIQLAESGPDVGVYTLWLQDDRMQLPAACHNFVEISRELRTTVGYVREAVALEVRQLDRIGPLLAERLARELAGINDAGSKSLDESDLPSRVALHQLLPFDVVESAQGVIAAWRASDSLSDEWRVGHEREPGTIPAVVGMGVNGPVTLDLREQGPHALVGGTTGAGKSEFLQTWIMSMAASVSPQRLTFLLVDYKGGAAFAECVDLPHTVGLVTDLSPHLVQRALTSLRAELTYREQLFNDHGAKDLSMMERNANKLAPPNLIIVIDEFAALAADVPEFVDGVVDVAARGRSLGVHLIMATQRPNGVINENLRANTNLRISLRMADPSDSVDVIDTDTAVHFDPATPGRGAVKVGPGRVTGFQTGYIGGVLQPTVALPDLTITDLPFGLGAQWPAPAVMAVKERTPQAEREIECMLRHIQTAARQLTLPEPRRPWVDELPGVIALDTPLASACESETMLSWTLGMQDDPSRQRQSPLCFLPDVHGHAFVVGMSGSGKSTTLRTIAAAATESATVSAPVWIYGIAGGAGLSAMRELPNVGDLLHVDDLERVPRLLRWLASVAKERTALIAQANVASFAEWLQQCPASNGAESGSGDSHTVDHAAGESGSEQQVDDHVFNVGPSAERRGQHRDIDVVQVAQRARIVLLIDGFGAVQETFEAHRQFDFERTLDDMLAFGAKTGIHVVLSVDRERVIPSRYRSYFGTNVMLNIGDDEAATAGLPTGFFTDAPAGRGIRDGLEVQIAVPGGALTAAGAKEAFDLIARKWAHRLAGQYTVDIGEHDTADASEHAVVVDAPAAVSGDAENHVASGLAANVAGGHGQSREVVHALEYWSAPAIRLLPEHIGLGQLEPRDQDGNTTIAMADDDFSPIGYSRRGITAVYGRSKSGTSSMLRTAVAAFRRRPPTTDDPADVIWLTNDDETCAAPSSVHAVIGEYAVRETIDHLLQDASITTASDSGIGEITDSSATGNSSLAPALDSEFSIPRTVTLRELNSEQVASSEVRSESPLRRRDRRATQPTSHALTAEQTAVAEGRDVTHREPGMVVIERITDFIGGPAEHGLEAILQRAARQRWHVIVEADVSLIGSSWELQSALRAARTTLVLRPEESDLYSVARVELPAEDYTAYPPGRGFLMAGGQTRKVQIALS